MQTKCYASLDFSFSMQMLFTMMQMQNVHMMHMSLSRDAIFMMQMSHAGVRMQSLSMKVPVHVFNRDANTFSQRWRYECLLMSMSWYKCPFIGMPWRECPLVGMQWCRCPFVGISWHECFDANTLYSKIPFIFKTRLPQLLKLKYFQNLIYYSRKVIFFFI